MRFLIGVVLGALFVMQGCPAEEKQKEKPPATEHSFSEVFPDRYEIHDARNGPFSGTVLLDKKTGRAWIMAHGGGSGSNGYEIFEEMTELPKPCAVPIPSGNGGCLEPNAQRDPLGILK